VELALTVHAGTFPAAPIAIRMLFCRPSFRSALLVLLCVLTAARLTAANPVLHLQLTTVDPAELLSLTPTNTTTETFTTPPPRPLFGEALAKTGQAHLLAVSHSGPQELTLYSYSTITHAWADLGSVQLEGEPESIIPTSTGFVVRVAGSTVGARIEVILARKLMRPLDWTVIAIYLTGMAGIGWLCYRRQNKSNTADYFLAGRNVSWWAAGLSLYATGTSALSFIALPAKSFATNWIYYTQIIIGVFGTIFVAFKIVPLIRRLGLTSVYHYLEMRFHPSIRLLSSALNIVFQLGGRMSIVLFLPALAVAGATGANITWVIILMGIVTTLYTVMGGMRAVIWTDVIQVFVMMGGALFAIGYMLSGIEGGPVEALRGAWHDGKTQVFDWQFNLTLPTVWAFILLEIVTVPTWPKDQVMTQRVLATRDERAARASVLMLIGVILPGSFLFFAIGTSLYMFYKSHPERLNPLLPVDATFPHFIAAELPVGITGLIIAGIFAASMSTLSSGINSVATLTSVDFYERFSKRANAHRSVRLAEWVSVLAGLIGTSCALLLSRFDVQSLFDTSIQLTAILGGGFAGTYALGIFTRRANWQGAMLGTFASIACAFLLKPHVSPILLNGAAIGACIVVGYIASYFFPPPRMALDGLTIFTPRRVPHSPAP
jgi:solute:Na+ symporter, SSS family